MKPIPSEPRALQARSIALLCADILDGGSRLNALAEIRKQTREAGESNKPPASNL